MQPRYILMFNACLISKLTSSACSVSAYERHSSSTNHSQNSAAPADQIFYSILFKQSSGDLDHSGRQVSRYCLLTSPPICVFVLDKQCNLPAQPPMPNVIPCLAILCSVVPRSTCA